MAGKPEEWPDLKRSKTDRAHSSMSRPKGGSYKTWSVLSLFVCLYTCMTLCSSLYSSFSWKPWASNKKERMRKMERDGEKDWKKREPRSGDSNTLDDFVRWDERYNWPCPSLNLCERFNGYMLITLLPSAAVNPSEALLCIHKRKIGITTQKPPQNILLLSL